MAMIIDEWEFDGRTFTRTYTKNQILQELDDIWGSEEYRNDDYDIHNRAEQLEELLKHFHKDNGNGI
jgi:hypothetical protein